MNVFHHTLRYMSKSQLTFYILWFCDYFVINDVQMKWVCAYIMEMGLMDNHFEMHVLNKVVVHNPGVFINIFFQFWDMIVTRWEEMGGIRNYVNMFFNLHLLLSISANDEELLFLQLELNILDFACNRPN